MLLDDDVVANGQAEPSPFTSWFGRKERVEQLLLHLGRDAGAVVADSYFDPVALAPVLQDSSVKGVALPRNQHKSLLSVRVRAAIEAVPFESPRLSATAVLQGV